MAYRKQKVEELIRRIVSEALIKEIQDPRIGFVTITSVNVSKDYAHADIGVSVLGSPKELRNAMFGLRSAQGYIQRILNKGMRMRQVPRIRFKLDPSIFEGVRMVDFLEHLNTVDTESEDKTGSSEK